MSCANIVLVLLLDYSFHNKVMNNKKSDSIMFCPGFEVKSVIVFFPVYPGILIPLLIFVEILSVHIC